MLTAHYFKLAKHEIKACKAQGYDCVARVTIHNGPQPTNETQVGSEHLVDGKKTARAIAKVFSAKPWNF